MRASNEAKIIGTATRSPVRPIAGMSWELVRVADRIRHGKRDRFSGLGSLAHMQLVPLKLMATGERGTIHDVDGAPEFVVRLHELGLQEGAEVQMVKSGSPCILAINEQRFSLRFDDQTSVLVEVSR